MVPFIFVSCCWLRTQNDPFYHLLVMIKNPKTILFIFMWWCWLRTQNDPFYLPLIVLVKIPKMIPLIFISWCWLRAQRGHSRANHEDLTQIFWLGNEGALLPDIPKWRIPRKSLLLPPRHPSLPGAPNLGLSAGESSYIRNEGESECQSLLEHEPGSLVDSLSTIHQTWLILMSQHFNVNYF